MEVIDHEEQRWFLLEHDGAHYLDVHCNISAFYYTFLMKLNEEEASEYLENGRSYIDKLAADIQYSAPAHRLSQSIYKERKCSKAQDELVHEAIMRWRKTTG